MKPSRASAFAAKLVTFLLILSAAFGLLFVVTSLVGIARGNHEIAIQQEYDTDRFGSLPEGAVDGQTIPVTVRIEDASGEQSLYALIRDLVPVGIVLAILWQLRGILRSVRDGDPFVPANVRRLRAIGFILLLAIPFGEVLRSAMEQALAETAGAAGSGLAFSLPTAGPIAALMVFVLAQVFADGIRLRDEVEGTV